MPAPASILAALALALGLTACGNGDGERVAELEAELQQNTEELRAARERYDRQLTEFTATVRERHAREIAELKARQAEEARTYTRTIRSLKADLDAARTMAALAVPPPEVAAPPPPGAVTPPSPYVVTMASAVEAEPFPVVVTGVAGERAVIGNHTSTRLVESDEEYRDSFGNMRKRMKRETYKIPEYGYRATATLHNPSEAPVTVFLRSGQGETAVDLAPGEEQTVSMDAARGAALVVRVDGRTASHDVPYP